MFSLKPSTLVVFEGLDAAGKTTQAEYFRAHGINLTVQHQPSGAPGIGREIYALTENHREDLSTIARQFLHLACHAQHYEDVIIPALVNGESVVMDRNWWSTVAYGYFDGGVANHLSPEEWADIAKISTSGITVDVLFYFAHPYQDDPHNTQALIEGYRYLNENWLDGVHAVIEVPQLGEQETHNFILDQLAELGLLETIN